MSLYSSERVLVEDFLERLSSTSPWGKVTTSLEFFYQRGRTDIIAVDETGAVIAFEAKLRRWKDALQQAYRNTCFAHRSYVVLPKTIAEAAHRHSEAFARRGVGICYVDGDIIVILHDASEAHPLQPWLSDKAKAQANGLMEERVPS